MDLGFSDATAVIAGGTRGIGLATALCLAADGCRVGLAGRDEARLKEAVGALEAAGSPEVLQLSADLASVSDVAAIFEEVQMRWGGLNVLVNAAGPVGAGRFPKPGGVVSRSSTARGTATWPRSRSRC